MSDKRVYGATGGDSSSETDELSNSEEKSDLGKVGQNTRSRNKILGNRSGSSSSVGASLMGPNDSELGKDLGAKPKVKHHDHGGKGKRSGSKGGDIWHNPTRKSAKSLRGQGQILAAARGGCGNRGEGEDLSGLVVVRMDGPRSRLGAGRTREPGKVSPDMPQSQFRKGVFFVLALSCPILSILFSDILRGSIGGSGGRNATLVDKTRYLVFCFMVLFVAYLFWLVLNFGRIGDGRFRRRNK
ncbi:hypothetical protein [Candidatus Ichthyocystis sparus]|uniref:hypothetical protein n=1 Tax=Candidatus Ichthyocystis sparus TaxID=1561004 RepID=UPI000B854266|nr:hypothetical protein [Candidatus Ichthyocystis sparus]